MGWGRHVPGWHTAGARLGAPPSGLLGTQAAGSTFSSDGKVERGTQQMCRPDSSVAQGRQSWGLSFLRLFSCLCTICACIHSPAESTGINKLLCARTHQFQALPLGDPGGEKEDRPEAYEFQHETCDRRVMSRRGKPLTVLNAWLWPRLVMQRPLRVRGKPLALSVAPPSPGRNAILTHL